MQKKIAVINDLSGYGRQIFFRLILDNAYNLWV